MSKIVTLTAAAVGYVLGARAGRPRYEQIAEGAKKVWRDPRVQQGVADAQQAASDKAPLVKDKISDIAHKAADKASSDSGSGTTKSTTTRKSSAKT